MAVYVFALTSDDGARLYIEPNPGGHTLYLIGHDGYSGQVRTFKIERIRERFAPLVRLCKERGVAMRVGTNHGSLSDRIMNRYGDTPLGKVESVTYKGGAGEDIQMWVIYPP